MKIGLLFCRGGPAGLWSPSAEASAIVAAAEINTAGGVLGEDVELVVGDVGTTEREAAEAAGLLVDVQEVDALVAMHPSSTRDAVARVTAGRVPYLYTPQFEGGAINPHAIAIGGTDDMLLGPALAWITEHRRAERFFLVGNDYIWPRTTHATAGRLIRAAGGAVVGAAILSFGTEDYGSLFARMRQARPHVVVLSLLGLEAVRFNRAFAAAGMHRHCLRLALAQDETVLYASGADSTEELMVASHYLAHVHTRGNDRFLEVYHAAFGPEAPPVNAFGQSCYEGMHALADLARHAGRLDHRALRRAARDRVRCRTARNNAFEAPLGGRHPVYVATVDGFAQNVVKCF